MSREEQYWQGEVRAFKKAGWLSCRALAQWGKGHQEPWLLLTNYPPAQAEWYGVRMWEELAFKDLKSNGCQWHQSRLRIPERAERLWLVMALAYAWVVSLGTQVLGKPALLKQLSRGRGNRLSVFKLGLRALDWYLNLVGRKRLSPLKFIAAPAFAHQKMSGNKGGRYGIVWLAEPNWVKGDDDGTAHFR